MRDETAHEWGTQCGWATGRQLRGGLTLVAIEGDEVEVVVLLVAFEAGGHGGTSSLRSHPSQKARRMGHPRVGVFERGRMGTSVLVLCRLPARLYC